MANPGLPDETLLEALHVYERFDNNAVQAARFLGIDRKTLGSRIKVAQAKMAEGRLRQSKPFEVPTLPDGSPDADELLIRRKKDFERVKLSKIARKLVDIPIRIDGPVGIVHLGDPHVDSDGTDIGLLENHVKIINKTEGLFGANLGDLQNNWVGRLARLYGEQSTSHTDAWVLTEWLVKSIQWIYLVAGNHDCLDEQTECLTQRGWVKYTEISEDDKILSLDQSSGIAEWHGISAILTRSHDGPMVSIEARGVNAMVTPNHRVIHKKRNWLRKWSEEYIFSEANNLPARFAIPVSGKCSRLDSPLVSDDEIRFCGWFLTDGGVSFTRGSPKITLYQSKDGSEIERILNSLGYTYSKRTRNRNITEVCGKKLIKPPLPQVEYVLNAGSSRTGLKVVERKGRLPSWANALSTRQFDVLLDALIAGDGTWDGADPNSKTVAVLHGTEEFLSSVQQIAVAHGWKAFLSIARGKDYRLNLYKTDWVSMNKSDAVTQEQYCGEVWCLTVPLGNFMVRRNGCAYFTGNCWSGAGDPLKWIARQSSNPLDYHGCRLNLKFPTGKHVRINARHDFAGHSQYNPAHGPMKAVQGGWRDHILTCGHKHVSFIGGPLKDPASGLLSWAIRCAGYKTYDRYAEEKGLPDQNAFAACVTIIDPRFDDDDPRLITVIPDVEEGAEFLKFKRRRK